MWKVYVQPIYIEKKTLQVKMKQTRKHANKKISHNKTIKYKRKQGRLYFSDYPDFCPNLTPHEMFALGSFGGTYWRPIHSGVTGKSYKNVHKKYPFWSNIPTENLVSSVYDTKKNKYKCKVGTSLEFWEEKQWITKYHPYGWVHWYCDFCMGRRCPDDARQIGRWARIAGPNGRFRKFLVSQILKKKGSWNSETISPKIRQVLQHWGYILTLEDYRNELVSRNKKKEPI